MLLSACDLSTSDTVNDITASSINSFEVVGNVIGDPDERIVLPLRDDNERTSSNFEFTWDAVSSDPYSVEVYMSDNSLLDDTVDGLLLQTQCGTGFDFTCEHSSLVRCAIRFDPDYQMTELIDENRLIVVDENGDPVMVRDTDTNGNFIVENERYFLSCPLGIATVTELEITDRMPTPPTYPFVPFNSYLILKVCATDEQACPEFPFLVQFLSSQP